MFGAQIATLNCHGDASNCASPNHTQAGDYEKTHLSFPVEASMDRIIITRPGDTPPVLGQELHETAESVKRRRKIGAGSMDWNTGETFTMCLCSAYADWIKWKVSMYRVCHPFLLVVSRVPYRSTGICPSMKLHHGLRRITKEASL
jgi:Protein of unknown function (DUF1769)